MEYTPAIARYPTPLAVLIYPGWLAVLVSVSLPQPQWSTPWPSLDATLLCLSCLTLASVNDMQCSLLRSLPQPGLISLLPCWQVWAAMHQPRAVRCSSNTGERQIRTRPHLSGSGLMYTLCIVSQGSSGLLLLCRCGLQRISPLLSNVAAIQEGGKIGH